MKILKNLVTKFTALFAMSVAMDPQAQAIAFNFGWQGNAG